MSKEDKKLEFEAIDLSEIKGGLQDFEPFHDGCGGSNGQCAPGVGCGGNNGFCAPPQQKL